MSGEAVTVLLIGFGRTTGALPNSPFAVLLFVIGEFNVSCILVIGVAP